MGTLMTPAVLIALLAVPVRAKAPAACLPDRPGDLGRARRYDEAILRNAERRRLNPRLVKAIIAAESQFSAEAVSPSGARGLMQLMPATARELGVAPRALSDPEANIRAGTAYLARLYAAAGERGPRGARMRRVIAAYHAGPSALRGRPWPESTRRYVRTVLSCYRSEASVLASPPPDVSRPALVLTASAWGDPYAAEKP